MGSLSSTPSNTFEMTAIMGIPTVVHVEVEVLNYSTATKIGLIGSMYNVTAYTILCGTDVSPYYQLVNNI